MRIDGIAIAESICTGLVRDVSKLKKRGIVPTLAVIQVGEDTGSNAYISQKKKAAGNIGALLIHTKFPKVVSIEDIYRTIVQCNNNSSIHGIVLQRPLPLPLVSQSVTLCQSILLTKDVDGFLPHSPFPVPVAIAVEHILSFCFFQQYNNITIQQFDMSIEKRNRFYDWLKTKRIVVLGRGETAGRPIADALRTVGCQLTVIHSQTPNPDEIIRAGDIIISCVGKPHVVRRDNIKTGAILLSVGLWRDSKSKLHGDYEDDQIRDVASFYTSTPGGVGPINVACLMQNLVHSVLR